MSTNLIIDGNNILYRTFHANNRSGDPDNVVIGLCIHSAIMTMNKLFRKFSPDDMIVVFDTTSWRKEYTKDLSLCVTNRKYKGHRRANQTPQQEQLFKLLDEHIISFADMLDDRTSILVLRRELLEGDDLMAAYVQMHRDDTNIVVSGDKDMMQLMRYVGVTVINPADGEPRSLEDWGGNADLFMFEKCIRGEAKGNDNIQSSYPRLLRTKILKALDDPFLCENIMNHTFSQLEELPDGEYGDVTYTTRDLFQENQILMDLRKQPDVIKRLMVKAVLRAKKSRGKYNHIKFLQFCTREELDNILSKVEDYVPMLSV